MKILMLNAYYEPEIAASLYLSSNLNEDLAKNGFEVTVYTPIPSRGVSDEIYEKYKNIPLEVLEKSNLKIHRFWLTKEGKGTISRALRYFYLNIVLLFKGLFTETDLIFIDSTPPTQGLMAVVLKFFKRVPVVYFLQDIFPDSMINAKMTTDKSLIFKIGKIVENITYKYVDRIIVISEDFKKNIMAKGVKEEKIDVVLLWVDENIVVPVPRYENILFKKYNLDENKFFISYCGNIGLSQNMEMLVDVAKELEEYSDIGFVIVGDGAFRMKLQDLIKEKSIKNITLLPFQPYEYISHVFSLGDAGLIISKSGIGENSVPSKTWSIMSAQRVVIASFDLKSELSGIIKKSNCGVCIQADEKQSLENAILELYNNREKTNSMGINGRKYILDNLTRKVGTGKLIKVIEKVVVASDKNK